MKSSIPAVSSAMDVGGDAPVDACVRLLPRVDDAEEEKRSGWQEHSVRASILRTSANGLSIFKPLYFWLRCALGLAVEGRGFVSRYGNISWVLCDTWWPGWNFRKQPGARHSF